MADTRLQVAFFWRKTLMDVRLLSRPAPITVGPTKRASFVVPQPPGLPRVRRILAPRGRGYRLRIWPGMGGRLTLGGQPREVAELLALPAPHRFLRGPAPYRELDLAPGDEGKLVLDPALGLQLQLAFVEAPARIGAARASQLDPLYFRSLFWSAATALVAVIALLLVGRSVPDTSLTITPERLARYVAPVLKPALRDQIKQAAEKKRLEREAAESKRAKGDKGRLGRQDAPRRDTVMPKGREDILREKVANTGVLSVLGNARASGSGLGRLLTRTESSDVEQALTGLEGARLVAGSGSGGLGVVGTGLGGGGTGFGRIQGSGALDVGAGQGRGRRGSGPGLAKGKEKVVQVGVETGAPDAEGGLSKEQISRVVRAHAAAVKYCYEKELQRQPQLSGKIELFWVVRTNGTVDRVKVAATTMNNRGVEGCIERQIRNWQFPKSSAQTIVQSFPFLFKGGA